jgi:hydroxyacylglutathione hydrolase
MIQPFPSGPCFTNAYVVGCAATKKAAVVDPAPDSADTILSYLTKNQLYLDKILITHSHWDHIADTAALKAKYPDALVLIAADDVLNLEVPGSDGLPCWLDIPGVKPDLLIKEGDIIELGSLRLEVISTPGHTPGGVCFYCKEQQFLLSGDTLFKGTIGNLSFPTARPRLMWDSLKKLARLPAVTKVYPGHGSSTTIGAETWLADAEHFFGS